MITGDLGYRHYTDAETLLADIKALRRRQAARMGRPPERPREPGRDAVLRYRCIEVRAAGGRLPGAPADKPAPAPEPEEPFPPVPRISDILRLVARESGWTVVEMRGASRHAPLARDRQIAMWLARRFTGAALTLIGARFCRDHSTVIHGCRKIDRIVAGLTPPQDDTPRAWLALLRETP